jgi:carbamate kinase
MPSKKKKKLVIIAIGGNSLIHDPRHVTVKDQYATCADTCNEIVKLIAQGYQTVITHGNGPQVGFILRRSELASHELHLVPLDSCGADTQGAIGYHIQRAMYNSMKDWPKRVPVATVVTQVLVDQKDPAFSKPTKPIGSFMDQRTALKYQEELSWHVVEDAGRGYRRVVPSPKPLKIIEIDAIRQLLAADNVVVAAGGGGIPVAIDPQGELIGIEAVIDKDLASSLLARELGADLLMITTAVEKVFLDFGKPQQRPIEKMNVQEAKAYIAEGHFSPGSMLPKILAALEFVEATGNEALITDPAHVIDTMAGTTGTRIVP